jgi:hypothetical protein
MFSLFFLLVQKETKKTPQKPTPCYVGALAALLGPLRMWFAPFVDARSTQRNKLETLSVVI